MRNGHKIVVRKLGGYHLEYMGIGGRIICNGSYRCCVGSCGLLDSLGSGLGPVTDSCEHGNEPSGCIKGK